MPDILGINLNSSALFYCKICEEISYYLTFEADEIFDGQIELDESYLGCYRKEK